MHGMDRALLEEMLAEGLSLAAIGDRCSKHPSTVGYWVDKHGLQATHHDKHVARGALDRDELERRILAGESIRSIARATGASTATVRHWLGEYGLRTRLAARRDARASAGSVSDALEMHCIHHGVTRFHCWGERYRCGRCNAEAVSRRRRRVKKILVAEHGGACVLCGYSRHLGALEFHHLDPADKAFSLAHAGVTRSLAKARAEASKCALLCANCHAEVEAGIVSLATDLRAGCPS
jgi:hypothetical protein